MVVVLAVFELGLTIEESLTAATLNSACCLGLGAEIGSVEAGVPVALATDCNPGSSHTESMPMVVVLAVFELGLTIEESLTAATLNSACCLGLGAEIGSVENGKRADLVLLDAPNLLHLVYHYGINPVSAVVKGGRVVRRQDGVQSSKS